MIGIWAEILQSVVNKCHDVDPTELQMTRKLIMFHTVGAVLLYTQWEGEGAGGLINLADVKWLCLHQSR